MKADNEDFKYKELTEKIVKIFYTVDIEVGLLLNFGPKPDFKRNVFDNTMK